MKINRVSKFVHRKSFWSFHEKFVNIPVKLSRERPQDHLLKILLSNQSLYLTKIMTFFFLQKNHYLRWTNLRVTLKDYRFSLVNKVRNYINIRCRFNWITLIEWLWLNIIKSNRKKIIKEKKRKIKRGFDGTNLCSVLIVVCIIVLRLNFELLFKNGIGCVILINYQNLNTFRLKYL